MRQPDLLRGFARIARALVAFVVLGLALPRVAQAAAPSPDLMARLAASSVTLEELRKRASFAMEGHVEMLDGDGKVTTVKESLARVVCDPAGRAKPHVVIVKATENGKDSTEDARKEARDQEAKSDADRKKEHIDIPFMADVQPKYVFDQVETDPNDPSRVRIAFTPKDPDSHSVEGSAWVNTNAGQFLSAGFKVCKPGMLVNYIHVTIELGAKTALGPAISRLTFEGKGGFLFVRKHFRGSQVMRDYVIAPPSDQAK